ncbi:MAG: coenzyme F420-0:L-glutamate ligase [Acidobacteria bacterium]|nr:coenzyme F420-0:L-glutamate ligase [Acidobacteriota bacterium]
MRHAGLALIPLPFQGEVRPGDDLVEKLRLALRQQKLTLREGDIVVIKHKIVSKAEGQLVELSRVRPSRAARAWANKCGGDPRLIELALAESRRVVRKKMLDKRRGVLITETHHGLICANSGVDLSNVDGGRRAALLPADPDGSARRLRRAIKKNSGVSVGIVISDSFGRPWREGLTEVAIGVAGIAPLDDFRGKRDSHGYLLRASAEAVADELACAAGLVCGKLKRTPVCIVRGYRAGAAQGTAQELLRRAQDDLFR